MRDEFGGVIVNGFVELKSKIYSIKKIDGKERKMGKRVSVPTEFDKLRKSYLMKILLDTK